MRDRWLESWRSPSVLTIKIHSIILHCDPRLSSRVSANPQISQLFEKLSYTFSIWLDTLCLLTQFWSRSITQRDSRRLFFHRSDNWSTLVRALLQSLHDLLLLIWTFILICVNDCWSYFPRVCFFRLWSTKLSIHVLLKLLSAKYKVTNFWSFSEIKFFDHTFFI